MNTFIYYTPPAICVLSIIAIILATQADIRQDTRARVIGTLILTLLIAALCIR